MLPERGALAPRLEAAGVDVAVHPLAVLRRRLVSPGGLPRLAWAARGERRRLGELASGCALVHSNTSVILGGRAAAGAAGVPHVLHVREIYRGAGGLAATAAWPLWRRRLQRADAIVCVSAAVARQFKRAAVVHDGISPKQSHPDNRMGGPSGSAPSFSVGVLGRIADWKGQDVLIRALAEPELAEIGARAVIAGDAYPGEEAPDVAALARELGVGDRVEFVGFRPDPEAVLASVDAVAVPSTRPDPLPNSALEALAARRPVVAANHGGLSEIVNHDETGLLVEPGDPKALARALRELADDPARRARMGDAAARDARARFGVERMLDEIERVYARLGITR